MDTSREPEVWKDIPGYEGEYQISSWGRVRSLERIVKGPRKKPEQKVKACFLRFSVSFGYNRVSLRKDGKPKKYRVSVLVADLFLEKVENKTLVNHINENKSDDYYKNLEYVNCRENTTFSIKDKTSKYVGVSYCDACNNKKWKASIFYLGKTRYIGRYYTQEEARIAYLNFVKENNIENKYV